MSTHAPRSRVPVLASLLLTAAIPPWATMGQEATNAPLPWTARYRWKEGDVLVYRFEGVNTYEFPNARPDGKPEKAERGDSPLVWYLTVERIAETGDATLRLTMRSPLDEPAPEGEQEGDAERGQHAVRTRPELLIHIDPRGGVSNVLFRPPPSPARQEQGHEEADNTEWRPATPLLRSEIDLFFTPLLAEPVAPGATWTSERDQSADAALGKIHATTVWTFAGFEQADGRQAARIEGQTTIRAEPPRARPIRAEIQDHQQTAEVLFDVEDSAPEHIRHSARGVITLRALNGREIADITTGTHLLWRRCREPAPARGLPCEPPADPDRAGAPAQFRRGMSVDETRAALEVWKRANAPADGAGYIDSLQPSMSHMFTVQRDRTTIHALWAWLGHGYYLVFVDGALDRAVPREPYRERDAGKRFEGVPVMENVPFSNEERAAWVLQHNGIDPGDIAAVAAREIKKSRANARRHMEPSLTLIGATLLTGIAADAPRKEQVFARYADLVRRYDATGIEPGMSTQQVEVLLGEPLHERQDGDTTIKLYGTGKPEGQYGYPAVEVAFKDGRATTAFTMNRGGAFDQER